MYPLNDKDLDRLSRDAAEHYDVESSASGWERLENRLDKELPVKKDRRRFLFWLTFVALLTGGTLVYMLGRTPATSTIASEEAGKVGKVPAAEVREAGKKAEENAVDAGKKTIDNTVTVPRGKDQQAKNSTPAVTANDGKTTPASVDGAKRNPATVDAGKAAPSTANVAKHDPSNSSLIKNKIATKTVDKNNSNIVRDRSRKPVGNKSQKQQAEVDRTLVKTGDQSTIDKIKTTFPVIDGTRMYQEAVVKKDIPAPAAEVAKKPGAEQNSTNPSKWEFGILTGPDFSNVDFQYNYKTGFNLGLTVGYRISNRLQVNTGLIYTKKYYKVDGEDFYPPKHSWISYQDVLDAKGSCNMFEIPINLRYDFAYNQKSRWFASTGLSSYIMNKQYYDCRYLNNMGQESNWAKTEDSTYKYLFSTLNFSIGYERALGRNFSIQAEPYFRLPMKGLGYGSIDMNSYGLFVTFKYKPSMRLPKKK